MIKFNNHNICNAPPSLELAKRKGWPRKIGLIQFHWQACRPWQAMMQIQRHKAQGREIPADLSRKPRHLPVIMKRVSSPYCLSVHYTVYYFTDCKRESQDNFHKNIKITPAKFGKEKIFPEKFLFFAVQYMDILHKIGLLARKTGKTITIQ